MGTRPNISESHSEMSTRVPFCIAQLALMDKDGDGSVSMDEFKDW